MNTKSVSSAAGVILAALQQNRVPAGIALALDAAGLLMTPETAQELAELRARVAELERRIEAEECRCPEPAPLCEGCRCRCHSSEDTAPATEADGITRRIAPTQALREPEPQPDPS
ncbi:hypothetical protein ACH5A7_21110 [Streptomyces sp. NPDC018955]|uniref:hypothetical protein n=1 Tax=Streptomyces sp. NPDC018955 TaxID=3365055 RepID=UPI00379CFA87